MFGVPEKEHSKERGIILKTFKLPFSNRLGNYFHSLANNLALDQDTTTYLAQKGQGSLRIGGSMHPSTHG
jgi:hypothetical protein